MLGKNVHNSLVRMSIFSARLIGAGIKYVCNKIYTFDTNASFEDKIIVVALTMTSNINCKIFLCKTIFWLMSVQSNIRAVSSCVEF